MPNNTRHPHADLIHLWAGDTSLKFEVSPDGVIWSECTSNPGWDPSLRYRIKEKQKKVFVFMTKESGAHWIAICRYSYEAAENSRNMALSMGDRVTSIKEVVFE